MTTLPTISNARPSDPSMDFELLREEGLRHLEQLATQIWTDFNTHDPGITILEALCYALTDLGYRANFPIADLLAVDPQNANQKKLYFTIDEILKCEPVTALDFRKILIDCPGIKNAWFEKALDAEVDLAVRNELQFKESEEQIAAVKVILDKLNPYLENEGEDPIPDFDLEKVRKGIEKLATGETRNVAKEISILLEKLLCQFGYYPLEILPDGAAEPAGFEPLKLNGLYDLKIELDDALDPNNIKITNKVKKLVSKKLNAHRSLCEDFLKPKILEVQKLCLCLHIEVGPEAEEAKVIAEVVAEIQEYLSPTVPFYSFSQLLDKGLSCEDICNGPILKNGFLLEEDLKKGKYQKEIFKSDLYRIILSNEDVIAVKEVYIKDFEDTEYSENWCYKLKDCHKGIIDICCSKFYVSKGVLTSWVTESDLEPRLDLLKLQKESLLANPHNSPLIPGGDYHKDLLEYNSIQYEFPAIYSIGQETVPARAPLLRKAQARQLQSYLLFYDQVLAGYLAQLANVRDLFAVEQDVTSPTQFFQALYEVPGLDKLLIDFANFEITPNGIYELVKPDSIILEKLKALSGNIYADRESFLNVMESELGDLLPPYREQILDIFSNEDSEYEITIETIGKLQKVDRRITDLLADQIGSIYQGEEVFLEDMRGIFEEDFEAYHQSLLDIFKIGITEENWELFIKSDNNGYLNKLKNLTENEAVWESRRNQLLDHLLARFGEQFSDFATGLFKASHDIEDNPWIVSYEEYLIAKKDYLAAIPVLGKRRSRGYNYKAMLPNGQPDVWNTTNVSGIKQKMHRWLGMGEAMTNTVFSNPDYELVVRKSENKDGVPIYQIVFRERSTKDVLLLGSKSKSRSKSLNLRNKIHEKIREEKYYYIEEDQQGKGRYRLLFLDDSGAIKLLLRSNLSSQKEAKRLLNRIEKLIDSQHTAREGFHIVEHILLRPDDPKDELLTLSLSCDESEINTKDPYSFWVTVMLPNWIKRFQNETFQTYFEQSFRMALPAHITPRFCWLDEGKMIYFESLWKRWREEKALCKPDVCDVSKYTRELVLLMNEMNCSCYCNPPTEEISKCLTEPLLK